MASSPTSATQYIALGTGDPAPTFRQLATGNPSYNFETLGGRYVLLCFFGSLTSHGTTAALGLRRTAAATFDDEHLVMFGVTHDRSDHETGILQSTWPELRFFYDLDGKVGQLYGALPLEIGSGGGVQVRRQWVLVDPMLRIRAIIPFEADGAEIAHVKALVETLPVVDRHAGFEIHPPVIILPHVFEPGFCRKLIDLYEADGGQESGFMTEENGRTVMKLDASHKRRDDFLVTEEGLRLDLQKRIRRRIGPEIAKVHQFHVTRMERYLVGCYSADTGGHFRAHRDNTTKGTAHRRFAVSINLNEDFDGGRLSFPEYGTRQINLPAGAACVFSCSLLHQVSQVTRGRRYAFLPFLYDDAAARIREQNNVYLDETVGAYVGVGTA